MSTRHGCACGGCGPWYRRFNTRLGAFILALTLALALLLFTARALPAQPPSPSVASLLATRELPDPFPARFETDVSGSGPSRFFRLRDEVRSQEVTLKLSRSRPHEALRYLALGETRDVVGDFAPSGRRVKAPAVPSTGGVCVVVRTFKPHMGHGPGNLPFMLGSLERALSHSTNWTALLLVTSGRFKYLRHIVSARTWPARYRIPDPPPWFDPDAEWNPGMSAYDLTDWAITQCPKDARWLLVTNGDNWYHSDTFQYLDDQFDVVGFDFYSRHMLRDPVLPPQPADAPAPCYNEHLLACRRNGFCISHVDLGAVVFSLPRWRREGLRFTSCPANMMQDGCAVGHLTGTDWTFKHVPRCMLSHNPNAWFTCMERNGHFYNA